MKQGLQLKFSQSLSLTPQLQQAIKLLQMSTLDLNQEIDALLQTNPLLEREENNDGQASDQTENNATASEAENANTNNSEELNTPTPETASGTDTTAEKTNAEKDGQNEPAVEEVVAKSGEFDTEFSDEYGEFSNGSRWDENNAPDDDDSDFRPQETTAISLSDHLIDQVKLLMLSERDQVLLLLLIDAINEDGYLGESLEVIAEQIPEDFELDEVELQTVLRHLQNLDPIGVGARDLKECLLLQLDALDEDTAVIELAKTVVAEHLKTLAAKDFNKIKKQLDCNDQELKAAQQVITQLNPRPGSEFVHIGSEHFIQHEVEVKKVKGIWVVNLNESVIPKLKINQLYAGILKRNRDSSSQYLQSQMQEAKWMIKNIQQRFATIMRVSQAIVDRQRNFFEYGEVAMRPLVLREIADELGLHESTISRVTTHKYMLTPRGIFELKYFFGSAVATDAGGTCSATAIRALIKKMVEEENPQKPYSDNQITQLLGEQGIKVARRTIAKYRESMSIPPASLRKTL